jgi:HD-GYP domain-containing protein (c-di-GMP phosphodiesterase class II)
MSLDEAFKLLKENSGKHFDKEIVEAFIRYYNKERSRISN